MILKKCFFLIVLSIFITVNSFSITEKEAAEQINSYFQSGMPEKAISLASKFTSPEMQRLKFIAAVKAKSLSYAEKILPKLENPDGELTYYIGLFYELKGDYQKAIDVYNSYSGENMYKAISLFASGRCSEKLGNLKSADFFYDKAFAIERTYFSSLVALGRVKTKLNKTQEAGNIYFTASQMRPDSKRYSRLYHSAGGNGRYTPAAAASNSFSPPKAPRKILPADFAGKKSGKIVRACLGEGILSVTVTLSSTGEKIDISCQNDKVLLLKNGRVTDRKNSGYKIFCEGNKGTVALSNIITRPKADVNLPDGSMFRGQIEFLVRDNALMLINHIDLEEYLYGVIPSEMFADWPDEALKAQAVAARSYILLRMRASGNKDYDVYLVKNTAYRGYLRENPRTTIAVDETFGIAMFNKSDKPLDAVFCTNCGGYSGIPSTAWGGSTVDANADFKCVPDKKLKPWSDVPTNGKIAEFIKNPSPTYSYVSPHVQYSSYRWAIQSTREELEELLDPEHSIGYIKGITVVERDISGRAVNIKVSGTQGEIILNTSQIRKKLGGLKSSLFICEYENSKNGLPKLFTFIGAGWGHGVGLCQSGAAGMALDGIGYKEILKHYYPLAIIKKCY